MGIKAILLDIDGVLCIRDRPIDGAQQALRELKKDFKVALVTNTTRISSRKMLEKLQSLGFDVEESELFTALKVAKEFLVKQRANAYFLVFEDAKEEFEDVVDYPVKYVLVADAYTNFTYQNLNQAFRLLLEDAGLIGVAPNRYFMDKDGKLSLDAGPFIKALEYASGKTATVIGKPSQEFFRLILGHLEVKPEEAIMVGDDIEFDVWGAQRNGIKGILVKTGKFREEDLKRGIEPDHTIEHIGELPKLVGGGL